MTSEKKEVGKKNFNISISKVHISKPITVIYSQLEKKAFT